MNMRNWRVLKGLLEKNVHDSGLQIVGFVLLSIASQFFVSAPGLDRFFLLFFQYSPGLIAVFWGVMNGDSQNRRRIFERTNLPISRYLLWFLLFCIPVMFLAFVILCCGRLGSSINGRSAAGFAASYAPVSFFALAYFLSSISSQRFALILSVFAVFYGPFVWQSYGSDVNIVIWCLTLGSSLAVLLSLVLKGRLKTNDCRIICVALMLLISLLPFGDKINSNAQSTAATPFVPHTYSVDNGVITIRAASSGTLNNQSEFNVAEFRNLLTNEVHICNFKSGWHAGWVHNKRFTYILKSDPGEHDSEIMEWDTKIDHFRTVIRLPIRPDYETLCESGHFVSVDSSGRYMIARLAAIQNTSVDLWLIDLKKGRGRVVMQNAAYFDPNKARWLTSKVLVPSYRSRIIEVDLLDGTARYMGGSR